MTVAILSAMREEIHTLLAEMGPGVEVVRAGRREYHRGTLWGVPVVLAFSRWGKVAAATTTTFLIERFGVDRVLFTGVAGGVAPGLRVGDVVVARTLVQHDLDARPLCARHEIPLLGVTSLPTDDALRGAVRAAAERFVRQGSGGLAPEHRREFHIDRPRVVEGDVASGDRFFANRADLDELRGRLPGVACVEMEGAAVAQVCHEYGVPCAVVRTVSDSADEGAPADFSRFVQRVASAYSHGILRQLLGAAAADFTRPATAAA
jgi:adenosylhomocysteine nucleosidase